MNVDQNDRRRKIFPVINRMVGHLAGMGLVVLMLLTVTDILLRALFNRPILGGMEIAEYTMGIISFYAIVYCAMEGGHVDVDLVVSRLKPTSQKLLEIVGYFLSLLLFVPMAIMYLPEIKEVLWMEVESQVLEIPETPFHILAMLAMVLLSGFLVSQFITAVRSLQGMKGKE